MCRAGAGTGIEGKGLGVKGRSRGGQGGGLKLFRNEIYTYIALLYTWGGVPTYVHKSHMPVFVKN